MKSLTRMAMVELQALIRADPEWRPAAWAEIRFRNQARQAFEQEHGHRPASVRAITAYLTDPATLWLPPDHSPPAPLGAGPLEGS